jgi:hypothetical protein
MTSAINESKCLRGLLMKDAIHIPNINMEKYPRAIVSGWRIARYSNFWRPFISWYFFLVAMGYDPMLALNNFELLLW